MIIIIINPITDFSVTQKDNSLIIQLFIFSIHRNTANIEVSQSSLVTDPQLTSVNAAAFASKFQSNREVYRFLSSECHLYLPPYECVTIFHLRDLAAKKRTWIKCNEVKLL